MLTPWKLISSQPALEEPWCSVRRDTVQLPDGRVVDDYFVFVRPDVVVVLAVSDDGMVPLVRQYKHGVEVITLELPAGTVEDEPIVAAGLRELHEETGWRSSAACEVASFFDDASKSTGRIHCVVARNAVKGSSRHLDLNESSSGVEVIEVPIHTLTKLIEDGVMRAQSSVACAYRALVWLGQHGSTPIFEKTPRAD
jgi:8-oxo-dGTP pyrophosphatase MutT (NUDIX family)